MAFRLSCFTAVQHLRITRASFSRDTYLSRCFSTSSTWKSAGQTVDREEVAKFSEAAIEWWNSSSSVVHRSLHALNSLRVPLIRNAISSRVTGNDRISFVAENAACPLAGVSLLDVGCGGGILSEPLARLGAQVTGIDASPDLIDVATWHASRDPDVVGRVKYICSTVEELCSTTNMEQFDGVVASEVIEHVSDPALFVSSCCKLVKPGGSLFFTTINRTMLSYAYAIFAAEYVLGLLPRGTHDWNKFISPEEIERLLAPDNDIVFTPVLVERVLKKLS